VAFTKNLLREKIAGLSSYAVTFEVPACKPGEYLIVIQEGVPVSSEVALSSNSVGHVFKGSSVAVLEIADKLEDGRVRGRIESPAGWISLKHVRQNRIFAVEAPARAAPPLAPAPASSTPGGGSPQGNAVAICFQPGNLGLEIADQASGRVTGVSGQAKAQGVRIGWQLILIDGGAFTADLLRQRSSGESSFIATFQAMYTVEVRFLPGKNGLEIVDESTGRVSGVSDQAKSQGVRIGWKLIGLDGVASTENLLRKKMTGGNAYLATFQPQPDRPQQSLPTRDTGFREHPEALSDQGFPAEATNAVLLMV
jgi:hypothetical protein